MVDKEERDHRKEQERKYNQIKKDIFDCRREKEVEKLYEKWFERDPFPDIAPALLNSADICRYVERTGMIYPFHIEDLSGATYEARIKGDVIWWDEKDQKQHTINLRKSGDYFQLKPNSIAFITLEPYFRIPDYMALRFNLKIAHIYKGLLLGTGPLVDPGFMGHLSIPLHNLTANTYVFRYNDGIIQMEFTKLSSYDSRKKNAEISKDAYIYKRKWFKDDRNVQYYIDKALKESSNTVVKSSFPKEIQKIRRLSKRTEKSVNKRIGLQDKKLSNMQLITILTLVPVLALACTAIYDSSTANKVEEEKLFELSDRVVNLENKKSGANEQQLLELYDKVVNLENEKGEMEEKLGEMEMKIEKLTEEIEKLEKE